MSKSYKQIFLENWYKNLLEISPESGIEYIAYDGDFRHMHMMVHSPYTIKNFENSPIGKAVLKTLGF